eukprot:scaffold118565_cov63-Phaeocystis_antarctica.AAC.4
MNQSKCDFTGMQGQRACVSISMLLRRSRVDAPEHTALIAALREALPSFFDAASENSWLENLNSGPMSSTNTLFTTTALPLVSSTAAHSGAPSSSVAFCESRAATSGLARLADMTLAAAKPGVADMQLAASGLGAGFAARCVSFGSPDDTPDEVCMSE